MSKKLEPGTKVLIDGTVRGKYIGTSDSGSVIVDLGFGTAVVAPERIVRDVS